MQIFLNQSYNKLKQRLFKRYKISGNNCWEWIGSKHEDGYGQIFINKHIFKIHRISAMLFLNFDINSQLLVCHKCDNPSCFNPQHLFIGTHADNTKDAFLKKRRWGKLKEFDVIKIRKLLNQPIKQRIIAQQFNIDQSIISDIKRNRIWNFI